MLSNDLNKYIIINISMNFDWKKKMEKKKKKKKKKKKSKKKEINDINENMYNMYFNVIILTTSFLDP